MGVLLGVYLCVCGVLSAAWSSMVEVYPNVYGPPRGACRDMPGPPWVSWLVALFFWSSKDGALMSPWYKVASVLGVMSLVYQVQP